MAYKYWQRINQEYKHLGCLHDKSSWLYVSAVDKGTEGVRLLYIRMDVRHPIQISIFWLTTVLFADGPSLVARLFSNSIKMTARPSTAATLMQPEAPTSVQAWYWGQICTCTTNQCFSNLDIVREDSYPEHGSPLGVLSSWTASRFNVRRITRCLRERLYIHTAGDVHDDWNTKCARHGLTVLLK